MTIISGAAIFWFIALGMVVGLLFGLVVKKEGIPILGNIGWGVFASVLTGVIGILLDFGDSLLFALVYTLAFLFLVNVFHQHHEEDIYDNVDPHIHLK